MSKLRLPNGDDHPEAASKHLSDATILNAASRADGAAYLAGYVVESSLKSLILVELGQTHGDTEAHKLKHLLGKLSGRVLQLAALPSSKTARYLPKQVAGHSLYDQAHGWRETLRYRAPGAVPSQKAQDWLNEAQQVFESTILRMRLDGVI
jgi:hypothetical protein